MTISSMTGYSRASGTGHGIAWQWDLKSVNGKAFDARFRLPTGMDQLEAPARALLAASIKRGNLQVALTLIHDDNSETVKLNEDLLEQVLKVAERLRKRFSGPPLQAELLLAIRGVMDVSTPVQSQEVMEARDRDILGSLSTAIAALVKTRNEEGAKLQAIVAANVDQIESLTKLARENPWRKPETIKARLKQQIDKLIEAGTALDPQRLHQEAVLAATRNDIQEEIDRLTAHVSSARDLLKSREPVGRKLDFLAQEFNREANTMCSKAADVSLTHIGLELKTVIDQLREQVQNIE
jgi:uncharacterized protein (TIGR00255 family)